MMVRTGIDGAIEATSIPMPGVLRSAVAATASSEALAPGQIGLAIKQVEGDMYFVLFSGGESGQEELNSLVRSFLYPSFVRSRPQRELTDIDSDVASEVCEMTQGEVRVLLAPAEHASNAVAALALMLETLNRRPPATAMTPRSIGQILRDFEEAVAREDVGMAEGLLAEAWSTGRLSVGNRSALRLRVLGAARAWTDALSFALKHRLPDVRLPAPVEHTLIRAVYHAGLESPLKTSIDAAVEVYKNDLSLQVGSAFSDPNFAASPEARKAWAIRYAAMGALRPATAVEAFLAEAPADEALLLREIASHGEATSAEDSAATAQRLLSEGESAAAWVTAATDAAMAPATRRDVLSRASRDLDDPVRQAAADVLGTHEEVLGKRLGEDLEEERVARVTDWPSWLAALYDDPEWSDAQKVMEAGAERWTEAAKAAGGFLGDTGVIEALAGEPAFISATPRLVRAATPSTTSLHASSTEVFDALAYAISSQAHPGGADLEALADLAEPQLAAGLSQERYEVLASQLAATYEKMSAPPSLARWIVEAVALVLRSPAPSEESRSDALRLLVGPLMADAQRPRPLVPDEVWVEMTELLAGRTDLTDLAETLRGASAQGATDEFASIAGSRVLLYSLVSSAARRAKEYLEAVADVKVWTDTSSVASPRLKQRAESADIVVVAARAAKHAAYDCIQAATPQITYASGKGWSSLVTAVRDYADKA